MPRVRDTVLLSGWLFADLLLALAVIFLVANTGGVKVSISPPVLQVNTTQLDVHAVRTSTVGCAFGTSVLNCTITITESSQSQGGDITWGVKNDLDAQNTIQYSPVSGKLSPGRSITIKMSGIPCENSQFTFSAVRDNDNVSAVPAIVSLRCKERLDFNRQSFQLVVHDINALISSDTQDDDIRQQVRSQSILRGHSVGLAIVYGGAFDTSGIGQAQAVANKVYAILKSLGQQNFVFVNKFN